MVSSPPSEHYLDPVRRMKVRRRPEERVRQGWLRVMIERLGFPRGHLAVEKELSELPHLLGVAVPKRRIDIVAFAPGIHKQYALFPLLLVECKAASLTEATAAQALSYNEVVMAPFVAVVNEEVCWTGRFCKESGRYLFTEGMPTYSSLLGMIENSRVTGPSSLAL